MRIEPYSEAATFARDFEFAGCEDLSDDLGPVFPDAVSIEIPTNAEDSFDAPIGEECIFNYTIFGIVDVIITLDKFSQCR